MAMLIVVLNMEMVLIVIIMIMKNFHLLKSYITETGKAS
jgi:ribosomal protein S18